MISEILKSIFSMPFNLRQKRLTQSRDPLSKSKFVQQIVDNDGDMEAAEIIHQMLQDWIYVNEFTPYPTDNLETVFGIAEEELDEDIIQGILNQLNVATPSKTCIDSLGSVNTSIKIAKLIKLSKRSI